MGIIKSWDIRRLRPFRKAGESVPDAQEGHENLNTLDPDLRPDEEQYVLHYLGYADQLLNGSDPPSGRSGPVRDRARESRKEEKIVEMPGTPKDEAA